MPALRADIGGGLLSVVALANAPVSVVQPISSGGLAILAVFSHLYLEERLQRREWAAVGLAAAGTVGVAACAPEPAAAGDALSAMSLRGGAVFLALLAAAHAALRWARLQASAGGLSGTGGSGARLSTGRYTGGGGSSAGWHHRMASIGPARMEELALGAQAGACFALSAAACRAGFLLSSLSRAAAPAGLAAAAMLTTAGVVAQTRGMKDGAAMVVCTAGAVATMLTGAAAGVLVLGEGLPPTRRGRLTWLLCWAAIAAGVGGISGAGGAGGAGHGHGPGGSLLPGGAGGKGHHGSGIAGGKIAITPLKMGVTAAVAAVGGASTPGATSGRLLLPLFARPPKEPDSAL